MEHVQGETKLMHLVFLDTETTGLDPNIHEVWEIAYGRLDGGVHSGTVPHVGLRADLKALELNGYRENAKPGAPPDFDYEVIDALRGNTVVCANPSFDVDFLYRRWGIAPWHHRKLDIESMAYGILGYSEMKGLKHIADDLISRGYNVGEPGHRAWIDVVVLRECYKALRKIRNEMWGGDPL
jgi:DNA polymerase III alpha subunit (gram-positive type)